MPRDFAIFNVLKCFSFSSFLISREMSVVIQLKRDQNSEEFTQLISQLFYFTLATHFRIKLCKVRRKLFII